ncbi:MAG: hypothetical protein ACFFCT_13310 [Candidatus Odinarchaeota archaeon]
MTDDDVTPSVHAIRSQIFTRQTNMWIISIFVFTILTASVLSYTGFLQTDPLTAAIDGFLVAIVYVGFRVLNAYRALRLHSRAKDIVDTGN